MNKKQRNRKNVAQNRRNRIANKRYSSTVKSLTKRFLTKINNVNVEKSSEIKTELKTESKLVLQNFYSVIDKAVKKGVIHKNNAARQKSKLAKLYTNN